MDVGREFADTATDADSATDDDSRRSNNHVQAMTHVVVACNSEYRHHHN